MKENLRVVDDRHGAPSVDPLSLLPPAILENDNPTAHPSGDLHKYKACCQVAHPRPLIPSSMAIKCLEQSRDVRAGRREPREQHGRSLCL
jgi:hypothetical protein